MVLAIRDEPVQVKLPLFEAFIKARCCPKVLQGPSRLRSRRAQSDAWCGFESYEPASAAKTPLPTSRAKTKMLAYRVQMDAKTQNRARVGLKGRESLDRY